MRSPIRIMVIRLLSYRFLSIVLIFSVDINASLDEDVSRKRVAFNSVAKHTVQKKSQGQTDWSYDSVLLWSNRFPTCRGTHQSPVDINTKTTEVDESLDPLTFVGYSSPMTNLVLFNNGFTIEMKSTSARLPGVKGSGLGPYYTLQQMHFHFGSSNDMGSEHTIDGKSFAMELHLVHTNKQMIGKGNSGIAVVSVLFRVTEEDNPNFERFMAPLKQITYADTETEIIGGVRLFSYLPRDLTHFYRYTGSLTTPPCTEGVTWTVFAEPVPIGDRQIKQFRKTLANEQNDKPKHLMNNFRPTQNLKGRKILEALPFCS